MVGNLRFDEVDPDLWTMGHGDHRVVYGKAMAVATARRIRRRQDRGQWLSDHQALGQVEQLLRQAIGVSDPVVGVDHDHGHWQCGK